MEYLCIGFGLLLGFAFIFAMIAGMWKVFVKAGRPGWESIIPIYNGYVLTVEIARKDILWFVLLFVPVVNFVMSILIALELARKFNKSDAYGIGLAFLPFIFYPMLGFGDAQYDQPPPIGPKNDW